jgi:fatty acid desaturase
MVRNEAWAMITVYLILLAGCIALGSTALLFIWLIPMALGQPFLRLYLLAEHGRCAHVANMLENSRTTYTNRLVRRLAWNMPYHAEHHSYPSVPFHKLPDLHRLAAEHLRVTEKATRDFTPGMRPPSTAAWRQQTGERGTARLPAHPAAYIRRGLLLALSASTSNCGMRERRYCRATTL